MASSRTGTSTWLKARAQAINEAQARGQTTCLECGTWLTWHQHGLPTSPEADHIVPHAAGGPDTAENIRIICRRCNQRLGAKLGNHRRYTRRAEKQVETPTVFEW